MGTLEQQLNQLNGRLTEACDALWDSFVDPREPYAGEEGGWWTPVVAGGFEAGRGTPASGSMNEAQLAELRADCRRLAATNEFAINGHENRVSYVVGAGHSYHVTVRKGVEATKGLAMQAQEVLDEFRHENRWHARQQETVRRLDRDGEVFLRLFARPGGATAVRFIEPDQVVAPQPASGDRSASFGVLTSGDDVEAVEGYYVDGRLISATEVQHRKANVDSNVKRGLPLFTPVRKNLRRADKLLRNMSVVAEVQSAIALIRKHRSATRNGVEQFVSASADATEAGGRGRLPSVTHYGPGTILDAPAGLEYDFPATGVDAGSYVAILQAELRAIAARLVMPEFMLSSNASNANYASTLVAEGPAMRMFQRLQASLIEDDCELMWRVIANAQKAGRLPRETRRLIEIQISPPTLRVRDPHQEARVDKIAYEAGVLSKQTWSQRLGLDYDQEQRNRSLNDAA
ncbi:MAG: phage portal protein [Planctomycetota bacterium]